MNEIQFIMIDTGSISNQVNMSDVGRMNNAVQISNTHRHVNKIIDFFIRLHFSYAINQKINLPGKSVWKRFCVLQDLTIDSNKDYHIVIVNNAIHRLSVSYLNELCRKDNIHLYSLLLDSYDFLPVKVREMIASTNFEKIYSFQKSDCIKYGFVFTNQVYSQIDISKYLSDEYKSDVYFIGADKGRIKNIYTIYSKLTHDGLNCDFTVVVNKKRLREYEEKYPGLKFTIKRIDYNFILKKIANTKCILELCQKGQDGLTMRFYEALFYNKMLITNNQTAIVHSSYNSNYMQVVNSEDEINSMMIKNVNVVDYGYDGRYSPALFMENLINGDVIAD